MYICINCANKKNIDIRFSKKECKTMCEFCLEINNCLDLDVQRLVLSKNKQIQPVIKNDNVS